MVRVLAKYSGRLEDAPKALRALILRDERIVGYTIEPDGCFIYTDSREWCDDAGAGTFSGRTVGEAMRRYRECVRRSE